jgi:hypothetical protein
MIGLFAVAEMIKLYVQGTARSSSATSTHRDEHRLGTACAIRLRAHWGLVVRASLLGLWIGVLPGIGAQRRRHRRLRPGAAAPPSSPETFGKGNVEGVIAPDATLGANEGGGLLPTLALGIPGGERHGAPPRRLRRPRHRRPARTMLTDHLDHRLRPRLDRRARRACITVSVIGLMRLARRSRKAAEPQQQRHHPAGPVRSASSAPMPTRGLALRRGGRRRPSAIIGFLMDKYHYSRANVRHRHGARR